MAKKDETIKWIEAEIRRIKNSARRTEGFETNRGHSSLDPTSRQQIQALELQKERYLKSKGE
ncbi:MAG: hypothetical protein EOP49_11400 [Sphingobacteriales bacterium]|nr:MAG: hypothetical protein EOP49_11400 [Sphingobacteriales bacterium]